MAIWDGYVWGGHFGLVITRYMDLGIQLLTIFICFSNANYFKLVIWKYGLTHFLIEFHSFDPNSVLNFDLGLSFTVSPGRVEQTINEILEIVN